MIGAGSTSSPEVRAALTMPFYQIRMFWRQLFVGSDIVLARLRAFAAHSAFWLLFGFLVIVSSPAAAQSVTVSNTTTGTISGTTTCTPAAPLVRTFTVGSNFVISDVNIGVLATHTWRGDVQLTLQSPAGTRVQLTNGDTTNVSGDNFNVLLDDAAATLVNTDGATVNHSTTAPPYQNTFRPRNLLSAFNGQNSAGTWRLEICDLFPGADNGSFRNATLYLMGPSADLSLTKTVSNAAPTSGSSISYTLTVSSAASSSGTAAGVQVRDILPAGFTFTSASGTGTYDSATGIWSVGSVPPSSSRSITISGNVNASAGATVTNTAEIIASSLMDPDSTVNNGVTTEDDYATRSFTVSGTRIAGTPPTVVCPNGSVIFDWNTVAWNAGNTSGSYPLGPFGNITFGITNPGTWFNSATYGGQSPARQNAINGGFGTGEFALSQIVDLPTRTSEVVTTINLPADMSRAQFRIFDVDFNANQFADRVEVVGYLDGATVIPVLTNGVANYVIGNQAFGDGASADAEANGNVVVTFQSAVDTIVIRYGDYAAAPNDPGLQGIALHDISFCYPVSNLNVTKVSSVISDPINNSTNPKSIPGALFEYNFTVGNPNTYPVQTIVLSDIFPTDVKMCVASIGGSGPVVFTDGSPASGLSYTFTSLGSGTDSLEFSNDNGSTWGYSPVADGEGCDANIDALRIRPSGSLNAGGTASFRARFKIL